MTFLIVEKDKELRRRAVNSLASLGYHQIYEAENADNAISTLEYRKIDFLITDWNSKSQSGIKLINYIKKIDVLKDMPVILATSKGNKTDVLEALKAGVDQYLIKPFTPEAIREKIEIAFKKFV